MGIALSGFTMPYAPDDEPELSSWRRRALAAATDLVLLYVLVTVTLLVGFALPSAPGTIVSVYALVGVVPTYYTVFHAGRHGQTPGKKLLGIAVHLEEGGYPTYGRSLRRSLTMMLIALVPVLNVVAVVRPARHPRKRAFHDDVAGTIVVRVEDDWAHAE